MKTMKNILQIPRRGVPLGCAAIADLLPLLDHPGLDAEDEKAVLAHLASCSACRDRQAEYSSLERDARRYLSPQATPRCYQTEELVAAIMGEDVIPSSSSDTPAPIRRLHRARHRRTLIPALAPVAAVLAVLLLAIALFSGRIGGLGAGGSSLLPGSQTELDSISMVSATEGWAVGYSDSSVDDANGSQVVVLHYLHGVWSPVRVPIYGYLYSVSMASATDGWATGVTDDSQQLVLHYDGKIWKRVQDVPQLGQIQMLSATDGWATSGGNFLWHYDGHTWTKQILPASLTADPSGESRDHLTMTSAVDGWFADNQFNKSSGLSDAAVLLHYSDGQWQISRRLEGATIASISMESSTDGWAMGEISNATPGELGVAPKPLLLHFTHGMWVQVKSPLTIATPIWDVVAMRSASDGWMAGNGYAIPQLFHYNGKDWTSVRVPLTADKSTDRFQISGFALLSAGDVWAIGQRISNANQSAPLDSHGDNIPLVTPFILHYSAGAWSVVPLKGIPYYPV